ncbi:MAG: hypothetical protein ACXWQO_10360 [Bdellovibrionota bacterium]
MKHSRPTKEQVCRLIEANVEQLLAYDLEPADSPALEFYRQVLLAFMRGDSESISRFLEDLKQTRAELLQEIPCLLDLTRLRYKLLTETKEQDLKRELAESPADGLWAGEKLMLLAAVAEKLQNFTLALELHKKAAKELLVIGATGKSLRARSNMIANLSNIEPERKLIPEYFYLYREAKNLRQTNIMATTLLNLSREYQKIGAIQVALKYCQRSLAASRDNIFGLIHGLALAHRGHLYCQLGRLIDAQVDLEQIQQSDFSAVKAAAEILAALLAKQPASLSQPPGLLRTWSERLEDFNSGKNKLRLSPVEEKLIQFLSEKPRSKFEITDHIFGTELHPLKAENRLKNLIHRVRKKFPGLIYLENEQYFLADIHSEKAG